MASDYSERGGVQNAQPLLSHRISENKRFNKDFDIHILGLLILLHQMLYSDSFNSCYYIDIYIRQM